jgi:hypothetical protein
MAAAPVVRPVFRKLRRLSINTPTSAVPELAYSEAWMPSGVFLKKTPPIAVLKRAREFWNRSESSGQVYPPGLYSNQTMVSGTQAMQFA